MARGWIDAEFEVIWAPLRRGDPHPTLKGVRFVRLDPWGNALWRFPPRFRFWQRALMVGAAMLLLQVGVYYGCEMYTHYWPR